MAIWGRLGGGAVLAAMVLVSFSPVPHEKVLLLAPENPEGFPVAVHGPAGGFGSIGPELPSGQPVGRVPTEVLTFAEGRRAGRSVVAEDGSVLMAGASHNDARDDEVATSGEMVIGAYPPGETRMQAIRLRATDGRESIVDSSGLPVAPTVTDLLPLPGGKVAFAAVTAGFAGEWPVFGLLTKVDGRWGVAWTVSGIGADPPNRLARLRGSDDIVATSLAGTVSVLRLSGNQVRVMAQHRLGDRPDRVRTDPTGVPGGERFVVGMGPRVQEFHYDSRAATIRPLSPAVLPGDSDDQGKPYGFGPVLYDRAGNLWLARTADGSLAVYTKRLCACPPDYDILQARAFRDALEVVQDAQTGTIAVLFQHGVLLAVRATGTGRRMRFEVGNPVDLAHNLLPFNENSWLASRLAEFGPPGRLWIPTGRMTSSRDGRPAIDHVMFSVRLQELFSPAPVPLPSVRGKSVTIEAERTVTTGTVARPGKTVHIDSIAHSVRCLDAFRLWSGCDYDDVAGNGFLLQDDSRFGFLAHFVEYRVLVPSDGAYSVSFHVSTFPNAPDVQVHMSVGGRGYDTPAFRQGGGWHVARAPEPLHLTAGEHTIRLGVTPGHQGWFLNSFTLHRI